MYGYGHSLYLTTRSIFANSASGGGVDPDAQAFITAAAITDLTQQEAINQLVIDLKGYGVWTKMKAVYPFVGGTASTHKFNLKNPLDTNAAFRLVFNGGWTHSSTGLTPNGTNAYANTFLIPSLLLNLNSKSYSIYSRTDSNGLFHDIGTHGSSSNDYDTFFTRYLNEFYGTISSIADYTKFSNLDSLGFYSSSRTASNAIEIYKNGVSKITQSKASGANSDAPVYISAFNNNGGLQQYSNRNLAFASIGDGLTDTEATNFYTAVQAFQTTLGRSIGTQTVSDADAQAFVTAANIQDQVEANAVNNLVIGMKADGVWSKMKAIYPFVGGTASTHKFNLKDPRDLDAAFRLSFVGGWTHSVNGALPSINGYAETYLNPLNTLSSSFSSHMSYYSRTDLNGNYIDMGCEQNAASNRIVMHIKYSGTAYYDQNDGSGGRLSFSMSTETTKGLFLMSRTANNSAKGYKNGIQKGTTNTSLMNTLLPNKSIWVSGFNYAFPSYSLKETAFASIGDGLTDTDVTNLYTRVQNFQTTLNRQV